jgi:hypothetical protein
MDRGRGCRAPLGTSFSSRKDPAMVAWEKIDRKEFGVMVIIGAALLGVALLGGCAGRTSILPNSDKALRKTSVEFAADAAKRTYPTDAPRGGEAQAQAAVDHGFLNRIEIVNLSDANWGGTELWVNEKYVVYVPEWPSRRMEQLTFAMLYDREGGSFPVNNKKLRVEKVEVFHDGKLYNVPAKLAD